MGRGKGGVAGGVDTHMKRLMVCFRSPPAFPLAM